MGWWLIPLIHTRCLCQDSHTPNGDSLMNKRQRRSWLGIFALLLACLLPVSANAQPVTKIQEPPLPTPPLTDGAAKPLLERGVPVDVRVFAPNPVALSADELDAPAITVWHGDGDSFGQHGQSIPFVNILGNVQPANDIALLRYKLNEGGFITLELGPDPGAPNEGGPRRVYDPGDFNIEIPFNSLNSGDNTIQISAQQSDGSVSNKTVTISVTKNATRSLPAVVNWDEAVNVNDLAQVADGHWSIENNPTIGPSVRPLQYGYDRLVSIGDLAWTDYEVTVPIVVNAISGSDLAYSSPSNGPGVGLILRWPGPFKVAGEAPYTGWTGLGALGWFHYNVRNAETSTAMQIITARGGFHIEESATKSLSTDEPYYFKFQVQTANALPTFRMKAWPIGQAEPGGWDLAYELPANVPASGSLLLVAHHVDANFGQVKITPIGYTADVTVNSVPNGLASGGGIYDFYAAATVTATPNPGYVFSNWTGTVTAADGTVTDVNSDENPFVFHVAGDTNLTPSFSMDGTVPVTLGWFLAAARDADMVDFRWQTATETGTAGFNVLAITEGGRSQLNAALIRSPAIDSVTPIDYSFRAASAATQFLLQELDINGRITEHGPFDLGMEYGVYSPPDDPGLTERVWMPLIQR